MSLLIKNARAYIGGQLVEKNILCEGGKITRITGQEPKAEKIVDGKGKIAIPGIIDPHVHFRDPGLTHKEDFSTGSRAAAKGGITTFLDMPNTIPPVFTAKALDEKRKIAQKKSIVNWGLHFGSSRDNVEEIKKARNITSVKVYLDHTTGNLKIDTFSHLPAVFDAVPITCFHAEGDNVRKAILALSRSKKGNMYLCHTSSEEELMHARENASFNSRIFVEVAPQHLFMSADDIKRLGAFAEMKPRLKTAKDQKALWLGIKNGQVNTIGTDHAPHTRQEKQKSDFPFGIPGVETCLPLLLDACHSGRIELRKIIELCSENPARIFRMKSKGKIEKGYDADITLIDMNLKKKVVNEELLTKCKWSPWDGKLLKGWPAATIANGSIVYDGEEVHGNKGKEITFG